MAILIRFAFFVALCGLSAGAVICWRHAPLPPHIVCPETIELGTQPFGSIAVGRFQLANRGGSELVVSDFITSCSCAGVEIETDSGYRRVELLRIPSGGIQDLIVRVTAGAKVGTQQNVTIGFTTNDPRQPQRFIAVSISHVQGGVFMNPGAVVFGEVPAGERTRQIIRLFDNNIPGRRVASVRSLDPDRFTATLLPLAVGEPMARHELGGNHIASVVVVPQAESGSLTGQVEIRLADENRAPDRVNVIGQVLKPANRGQ